MVVGAAGVARRSDVPDHRPLLHGPERSEARQVRVIHVPVLTDHPHREPADLVRRDLGDAVERSHDRGAERRGDVVALVDVIAAFALRVVDPDPEIVGDGVRTPDGADRERTDARDLVQDGRFVLQQLSEQVARPRERVVQLVPRLGDPVVRELDHMGGPDLFAAGGGELARRVLEIHGELRVATRHLVQERDP